MITGFNHNLRVKGVLLHVQTEDKGKENPVVETQVFHGGNVLAVRKSNYAKFVLTDQCDEIVLAMMKEQHKSMMRALADEKIPSANDLFNHKDEENEPTLSLQEEASELEEQETKKELDVLQVDGLDDEFKKLSAEKTLDELILDFLKSENDD